MLTPFYYVGFNGLAGQLFISGLSLIFGLISLLRLSFEWLKHGGQHFSIVDRQAQKPKLAEDGPLGKHLLVRLPKQAIRLHCVESGDPAKQLMLLVHGFPENWYSWKYQITEFQADYHVVAVNMRGYGDSDKPIAVRDYATDKLVADLVEVIGQFSEPDSKTILVAHDWGGVVAWLLAQHRPDLVDRFIVLNAPHPQMWRTKVAVSWRQFFASWYMFFFNLPYLPEVSIMSGDFAILERMFTSILSTEEVNLYKYYFGRCFGVTGPLNFYRASLRSHGQRESNITTAPTIPNKVRPKTLIVWGDQDVALVTPLATDSLDLCEDGRVRIVEGASHWVQLARPKEVNYHMRRFLEEK